ncbi:unnamed protein product [Clonostachys rosea]|uniref:Major facilitator superfamily (MFS) profile domain-containing protein n=1 Tax=Bionectria ochroleuca TaxID=29856 RepID=A0ABY6UKZ0_BIOOC|nr:unnamed protein product [Clonostachys rosea]
MASTSEKAEGSASHPMATNKSSQQTSGTVRLFQSTKGDDHTDDLQFVLDSDGNRILLVPQPSLVDPNDPLRWPAWKKWATFLNGVAYTFMGSVTGPIMAAGMIPLSETFGESLQRLTYANGATLVCQGVGNIFWMPFVIKFGRRPVYLLSNILMGVACVWLGFASKATYTSFIIGRAFLGLFEAPIESIVPTTIADLFFLHERSSAISFYGLCVLGGNELGPLFSALIIQPLGMSWAFYIVAMFIALSCITMFFFMPETKYNGTRPDAWPAAEGIENVSKNSEVLEVEDRGACSTASGASAAPTLSRRTFLSELRPWQAMDPNISLRKVFLRPFILVSYPTVLWACLIYGLSLSWNVILGAVVAQLFAEPYGFDSRSQGLIFLSPFVGSLVGAWLCGPPSESVANYLTRKNDGIREPEMRLPPIILSAFLTFTGALMAGLTYHYHTHWAGPIIGFGVLSAGAQMGVSQSMSYAMDCHEDLSVELMVTVASLKSLIAWIWTWTINDWVDANGMLTVFMAIASINIVVQLTTIGMYMFGKRIRASIQEKDMLTSCGLN